MVDQSLTDMNADQTWERPTKVCRFCLHFASLPARDAVPLPADPSHARRALHRLAQRPFRAEDSTGHARAKTKSAGPV